jgi:hypothetical protein
MGLKNQAFKQRTALFSGPTPKSLREWQIIHNFMPSAHVITVGFNFVILKAKQQVKQTIKNILYGSRIHRLKFSN